MNPRPFFIFLALLMLVASSHAQTVTQTFPLHAGWNSIWFEVEPPDRKPATVFAGLPVTGVWTYIQEGAVEFIADQAEAQFNQPGWIAYFPAAQPEAFPTSLFAIPASRRIPSFTNTTPITPHDNLNATFTGTENEAYQIVRTVELTFTATDPGSGAGATALEYGSSILGGTYRETITGLHKRPLVVTGTFRISQVSNSPVLNQ